MQRPDRRRAVSAALLGAAGAAVAAAAAAVAVPAGSPCAAGCSAANAASATESTPARRSSATPDRKAASPPAVDALVQPLDALRIRSGCRSLTRNSALQRAARAYAVAVDGSGGVSHVDGVGGTAQDRAGRQGYRGDVIELVAQGSLLPDEFGAALVQMANRSDLLDCRFRSVGAAVAHRHLVVVLGDR